VSAGADTPARSFAAEQLRRAGIADWCIRHKIGTTLLTIALVLLGVIAVPLMPMAPIPEVDLPTISVGARMPGASPETMASAVATPLEVQLSGVPGIREMTSSSTLGSTSISLQFVLGKDIDVAAQEVQAALNNAAGRLPRDLPNPPTWKKGNPNDSPILALGMQSELMSLTALSDLAETVVARRISQVDGVAEIEVHGSRNQHCASRRHRKSSLRSASHSRICARPCRRRASIEPRVRWSVAIESRRLRRTISCSIPPATAD